jgi:hypothetical protein
MDRDHECMCLFTRQRHRNVIGSSLIKSIVCYSKVKLWCTFSRVLFRSIVFRQLNHRIMREITGRMTRIRKITNIPVYFYEMVRDVTKSEWSYFPWGAVSRHSFRLPVCTSLFQWMGCSHQYLSNILLLHLLCMCQPPCKRGCCPEGGQCLSREQLDGFLICEIHPLQVSKSVQSWSSRWRNTFGTRRCHFTRLSRNLHVHLVKFAWHPQPQNW